MGLAFLFPVVTLLVAKLIRPQTGGQGKLMPYECGVDPDSDARQRYAIRYYVVAILFVIFDVETIFLFPWAIIYRKLALFGLAEMLVFLGILIVGYVSARLRSDAGSEMGHLDGSVLQRWRSV